MAYYESYRYYTRVQNNTSSAPAVMPPSYEPEYNAQIDMNLRTEEHSKGIQDMLNALSSKCGFGENHYKYERGSIATATQIVSENSTLFRTLKKHEII